MTQTREKFNNENKWENNVPKQNNKLFLTNLLLRNDCYYDLKLYIVRLITKQNDSKKNINFFFLNTLTYPVLAIKMLLLSSKYYRQF